MFFPIVLAVWTVMNAYVLWRICLLPSLQRVVPRAVVIAVIAVLWSSYLAARFLEHAGIDGVARVLEWTGAHWLGVVFITFLCFLLADLITGWGRWMPTVAPRLRVVALIVACGLSIMANVQGRRAPVVRSYEVTMPGLPSELDGTAIAVMSDTHLGTMVGASWLDRRIAQVNDLHPDIVVLAGDIIEGDNPAEEEKLASGFRHLSAPMGVWGATGNHEFFAGVDHSLRFFQDAGVNLLRDQSQQVRPGLVLAGVDDLTSRRRRGIRSEVIGRTLAGRPPGATILISHSPLYPEVAADAGANLMISGHTHNGQIWPFNYFVRALYPLVGGRYQVNGMTAIVCRGTAGWGPRMRLWGRGEILKITLRAGAKT